MSRDYEIDFEDPFAIVEDDEDEVEVPSVSSDSSDFDESDELADSRDTEQEQSAVYQQMNLLDMTELVGDLVNDYTNKGKVLKTAQMLLTAGAILNPSESVLTSSNEDKKLAASRVAGNMDILNKVLSPQVVDTIVNLIAVNRLGLRKKDNSLSVFGELISKLPVVMDTSNYILGGLRRISGVQIANQPSLSGHEIFELLKSLDASAVAPFTVLQTQSTKKGAGPALSEADKEAIARDNSVMAETAKYLSSFSKDQIEQIKDMERNEREVGRATAIEDAEDTDFTDYTAEVQSSEYLSKIETAVVQIMRIYDGLFESCISLGRIFGILSLNQTGSPVVIRAYSKDRKIYLDSTKDSVSNNSIVVSEWWGGNLIRNRYFPPGTNIRASSQGQVPSLKNFRAGINYYPYFVLYYALGFVKGKRHTKWNTFRKALESDVRDRIWKITREKVDGVSGIEFVSNKELREQLISAFTLSALVMTGDRGLMNFQVRLTSSRTLRVIDRTQLLTGLQGIEISDNFIEVPGRSIASPYYDVQGYLKRDVFLSKPSWAYQALGRIYAGGEKPDLKVGVPIGLTAQGDIVRLRMGADNQRMAIGLFAGSRSGKGVQTLATLCAALGGGAGFAYTDGKPDMATIMWDLENKHPGLHTYALDTRDDRHRIDKLGRPHKASDYLKSIGQLSLAQYAGPFLYTKNLQLMTLVADIRAAKGYKRPMLWIMDEVTIAASEMETLVSSKGAEKGSFLDKWAGNNSGSMIAKVNTSMNQMANAKLGLSGITVMVIGQDPTNLTGAKVDKPNPMKMLFYLVEHSTNQYIVGRGLAGIYLLGTKALKKKDITGFNMVEGNRFFEMRQLVNVNVSDGENKAKGDAPSTAYESTVFKPFLAVNTDDVMNPCWTTGIGKSYGYDDSRPNDQEMLNLYKQTLHDSLGDPENPDAIVHRGTGFYGLLDTYFSWIENPRERQAATDKALASGYDMIEEALESVGILGDGNMFGYQTVEDFIYDLDPEKNFCSVPEVEAYIMEHSTSTSSSDESGEGMDEFYEDEFSGTQPSQPSGDDDSYGTSQGLNNDNFEGTLEDTEDSHDTNSDEFEVLELEGDDTFSPKAEPKEEAFQSRTRPNIQPNQKTPTRRQSSNEGAVYQNTVNCEYNSTEPKTGRAKLDSSAYKSAVQRELRMVDSKFSYSNHFLNKYGSASHYKARQKAIMNVIKTGTQTRNCERVYIGSDDIEVNGVSFGGAQGYSSVGYYNFLDCFDFPLFFKRFPNIKYLKLDSDAYELIHSPEQLGYGALEMVFRSEQSLREIVYPNARSGKLEKLTRALASRAEYVKQQEKLAREEEEAIAALEDSFLFGGNLNSRGGEGLRSNEKNRSRARRATNRKNTNPKSRSRASRMTSGSLRSKLIGTGALTMRGIASPFRWIASQFSNVRNGF